jgi:hypothetical protein
VKNLDGGGISVAEGRVKTHKRPDCFSRPIPPGVDPSIPDNSVKVMLFAC